MNVELEALVENHTWDVVDLPPRKKNLLGVDRYTR